MFNIFKLFRKKKKLTKSKQEMYNKEVLEIFASHTLEELCTPKDIIRSGKTYSFRKTDSEKSS